MPINYPGALDDTTSLPTRATGATIPATDSNDPKAAIIQLETKLGISASTPSTTNKILYADGAGSSLWGTLASAGIAASNHAHAIDDLSDVVITTPSSGQVIKYNGTNWINDTDATASGGSGDVTSNTATSVDSELALFSGTGGKTIKRATTTGILKGTSGVLSAATAGTDYSEGTAALATGILKSTTTTGALTIATAGDFPTLNQNTTGTAANVTGTVAIANGGTGQTAKGAAFDALSPMTTQGDIIFGGASGTGTRLPKGTAAQVLTMNAGATAPEWAAAAGGGSGQTLVTHIVAASGGTHTTLGAAIAAATAGDTIWVREGTYAEAAITSALANITIIGENPETAVISMGANVLTLSGAGVTVKNVGLSCTTGNFLISGANSTLMGCTITSTNATNTMLFRSNYGRVIGNRFENTGSNSNRTLAIEGTGTYAIVSSNTFQISASSSSSSVGIIHLGLTNISCTGNTITVAAGGSTAPVIRAAGEHTTVSGNTIYGAGFVYGIILGAQRCVAQANVIYIAYVGIQTTSSGARCVIANNVVFISRNGADGYGIEVGTDDCTVNGNYCANASTTAGSGITVVGVRTNNVISNNRVRDFANGINIQGASTNTSISGNNLENVTTAIVDSGVGTDAVNNMGVSTLFERRHMRMKNTSGAALAAGDVVTYKAVAAGDEVTTTTTAGDTRVYGMAVAAISSTAYGYVQILGKTTALKVNGTTAIAVGDYLTTFTTAGIAAKAAAGQMAFAIALEAYAVADSAGVIDAVLVTPRLI